ncbi:hypothetical protein BDV98DRAFT_587558 [Pterulicium gracile]|uniref:CFEM domain-containing protein n=1 Tax=Pterulicium gracile TaxID=1884261 RepID=A0A5C3QYM1_9AGAR|nr:hypothetical protein BDV98DRAFT_587558 [Pterula gracilis]
MAWSSLVLQLAVFSLGISAQSESSDSISSVSSSAASESSSLSVASQTASAEFPSLSGYPSCVSNCLALSIAAAECLSPIEVDCYCGSTNATELFTSQMVACIEEVCPNEHDSAQSLAQEFCDLAANSTSLSFPESATSTPLPIPSMEPTAPTSDSSSDPTGSPPPTSDTPAPEETGDEGAALHNGVKVAASGVMALALGLFALF